MVDKDREGGNQPPIGTVKWQHHVGPMPDYEAHQVGSVGFRQRGERPKLFGWMKQIQSMCQAKNELALTSNLHSNQDIL